MFKGTERFKPGEFDRAMESQGNIINAATWKDFTFYYVSGPKGTSGQNFKTTLDMHADMLTCSTLPDEEIGPCYDPFDENYQGEKRERSVVIEEIGMREDQPWTKVYNSLNKMMYPEGHPYRRDVIGTREIIGSIPRTSIVDYYDKWYSPQNMITLVVGDFELDELEPLVLDSFKFKNDGSGVRAVTADDVPSIDAHQASASQRHDVIYGDYTTSFFIQGYHVGCPRNLEENIALDVISQVLGEGRSSRLTQELVEKPEVPVFNFIGCGQSAFKLGSVFFIQGNFLIEDHAEAMRQMNEQINRLLTDAPITHDECTRALKKLKVDFAETSETASGIADALGESLTVIDDINYYLNYLEVLNTLTADKVNAVAQKYLAQDKAYLTILVPQVQQAAA